MPPGDNDEQFFERLGRMENHLAVIVERLGPVEDHELLLRGSRDSSRNLGLMTRVHVLEKSEKRRDRFFWLMLGALITNIASIIGFVVFVARSMPDAS